MARWKDDEDRGEFGAWLSGQVGDRTFDWLAAEMAARGHVHGADYYRAMASGNKPPGRIIGRALREYFGAPTTTAPARPGATETPAELVAAIDRLREAVERQTTEQAKGMTALAEVLGDVLGQLGGLPGRRPAGSPDPVVEIR